MPDGKKLQEFVGWCAKNITGDEKGQGVHVERLEKGNGLRPGKAE